MSVYIIAEIGCNHNGNPELAFELIRQAKKAGVDCVKFQTFTAKTLSMKAAPMAEYQIVNVGEDDSQYEMLEKLEFPVDRLVDVKKLCKELDIDFMSTPFSIEDIVSLEKVGIEKLKLPSGEINNKPYLKRAAKTGKPIILSTGMSTLDEVEKAVNWIYEEGNKDITLLHCTSNYPAAPEDANMRAMLTLKEKFGLPVGYSDHTEGITMAIMAATMGAEVIEKHMTLDKNLPGPDHKASAEPWEMAQLVEEVRKVEVAFGTGEKKPKESELPIRDIARKSIVSSRKILKGSVITDDDLCCKRPGTGLCPEMLDTVIGKTAAHDIEEDVMLCEQDYIG